MILSSGGGDDDEITGYLTLTDDTGVLTVDAPIEWDDIDTTPNTGDDGTEEPMIIASPSIDDYVESYVTPGLTFTSTGPQESLDEVLAEWAPVDGDCTDAGIEDYSDAVYTGRQQTFTDCSDTTTTYVTVAAVPEDNSYTAIIAVQMVSDADHAVLDEVLATFIVEP